MRRAPSPTSDRRDRYSRENPRRRDDSDELDEERESKPAEEYDPFADSLDGARSVHELSGKAAVPPPSSYKHSSNSSWRGRGGRDGDRYGSSRGGSSSSGFSLAALAKMPAQRKAIWAKPTPAPTQQQEQQGSNAPARPDEPVAVWHGAEFDDAAKKAKFLALMGARNSASTSSSASSSSVAPPSSSGFASSSGAPLSSAEIAEREQQLAATYAAAATHTRGTGLGAS